MTAHEQTNIEFSSMTWEQFYDKCKAENLIIQYWNVNSISQSIEKRRITLREINDAFKKYKHKIYGECDGGVLYCYEWLNYLNEVSNINKPLPPAGAQKLSFILYAKYFYFYLSDLKLILEGILEGKYGKFYGSVDAQLIMTAFKEYADKRKQTEYEFKNKHH
ncbi:MAG: hypothetical protein LBJ72_08520 [Dysgonamonadaceae bacterium]|jgi:hypothetical protein|nr:hypothetical protein [Dysgonamonadaceae bacterium]